MPKYFWLLSDGKTVREISIEEFRYLSRRSQESPQGYLLLVLFDSEIHIAKGQSMLNVPLKQLNQVLKLKEA